MTNRVNNLLACFIGCVIAAMFGLVAMLRFDAPILAMLSAGVFPPIACRIAGISHKKQLCKIGVYAVVGWMLTFMLQPAMAQSSASHARRIVLLPFVGYEWHVPASAVSTLLALIGVYFVPVNVDLTNKSL